MSKNFNLEAPLDDENLKMPQDLAVFMAKVKLSQNYIKVSNATIEGLEDIKQKVIMATQQEEQSNNIIC